MMTEHNVNEPIRILTIDNGGLQAISVLQTLRTVCQQIAEKNGEWKAPHELFDVIAGIGTGGWLAILLGRYKLDIDQCLTAYIKIANAINPNRALDIPRQSENPTAISQQRFIEEIDKLLERKELGKFLVDRDELAAHDSSSRQCYAFAVGVVKHQYGLDTNRYDTFRTYTPPAGARSTDPDPTTCRVSAVCAATAAAKCFMQEYKIGQTVYWDEDFPNTHCISDLALDEADLIFALSKRPLGVVLNIGPGVPTKKEIKKLQRRANSNATKTYRIKNGFHRAWERMTAKDLHKENIVVVDVAETKTASQGELRRVPSPSYPPTRSSTGSSSRSSSSLSKRAREQETKHQKTVKDRLLKAYGQDAMYYRLALDIKLLEPEGTKIASVPYLNDIEHPLWAGQLIDAFLQLPKSRQTIRSVAENWSIGQRQKQQQTAGPAVNNESQGQFVASSISFAQPDNAARQTCGEFDQNTSALNSRMHGMRGAILT